MIHPAGLAASARRAVSAALLLLALLWAAPAIAGDRALVDFIGFSGDGAYFAFEEFGVQDGSGFAYSNIYVVDLKADKWLYGSPFHVQADDAHPDLPLNEVRAAARAKADGKLKEAGITVPVEILNLLADGAGGSDGHLIAWATPRCCQPGQTEDTKYRLILDTFPADSPEDCVSFIGNKALGYSLKVLDGATSREVHRDGAMLPRSRGCPVAYRIYAVVSPFERGSPQVALISSYPFGFEGPDRRFLAVPLN